MKPTALILTCCALLLACSGNETPPDNPDAGPTLHVVLSESELTLTQGGAGRSVDVRAVLEDSANGPVEFSVVQPGANKLVATLDPVNDTQKTLKIRAPMDVPAGPYTLYVKGAAGDARGAVEVKAVVNKSALLTLSGTVRNFHGVTVAGAAVKVVTASTLVLSATADASGRFTVGSVLPPYNVTVTLPGGEAHTFVGLTRADPLLNLWTTVGSTLTQATLVGTLSGGAGLPNPQGVVSQVVYTSTLGNLSGAGLMGGQGPDYFISAQQVNDATASGRLDALQWEALNTDTSSIPVKYRGYGRLGPFTSSGATVTGKNVTMVSIGQSLLSGTIQPLAGMTVTAKGLGIHLNARGGFWLALDASNATSFSYPVPVTAAYTGRYALSVSATSTAGSTLQLNRANLDAAETVPFALRTPPALSAPANGSTGAVTALTWTAGTLTDPLFVLRYQATGGASQFVYTTKTSQPVSLKAGTQHNWNVAAYGGFGTVDAFAAPGVWPAGYPLVHGDTDFDFGATQQRTFTTAP